MPTPHDLRRQLDAAGLGHVACPRCEGVAAETAGPGDAYECRQCGALVDIDEPRASAPVTAESLRLRRVALGLTAAEVAAAFWTTENTILRQERGELRIAHPGVYHLALCELERRRYEAGA